MRYMLRTALFMSALVTVFDAYPQTAGWFTRMPANQSGLLDSTRVHFVSVADVNNDGYPDVLLMYSASGIYQERRPLKLYLNTQAPGSNDPRDRRFIDVTAQSMLNIAGNDTGQNANCYTLADFNNDGNIDLVTGMYYHRIEQYPHPGDRAQVYLGDGTGKFVHKPGNGLTELGLINYRAFSALDYDRDGNLDLFIPTWFKDYTRNIWDYGRLMKGRGDGTFEDVTVQSGINGFPEPMYGGAATDWDNDCYPDIFTAPYCRTGGNLFKNKGDGTFSNVSAAAGYNLLRKGNLQASCTFGVYPEDVNNDGNMDVFLAVVHGGNAPGEFRSTIAINKGPDHNYTLDINESLLPVSQPASSHRGDYDAVFLDFENDGLKDLVMVQSTYMPNTDRTYFWHQQPDGTFKDATRDLGLLVPALKNSLGIEAFDYDLDGDDDLLILGTGGSYFDLWRNNADNISGNNYLTVNLRPHTGSGINFSAIGTRVYVYYGGKMQMKEVMAGRGMHTGQQPFLLNFGLGKAAHADSIVIRWPDSLCSETVLYNVPANQVASYNRFPIHVPGEDRVPAVKVFPNPSARYVILQEDGLVSRTTSLSVSDIMGRVMTVKWHYSDSDKMVCDLGGLPPGRYYIRVTDTEGRAYIYPVVRM